MPKMTGARAFAEMMVHYEVSHIFFVPVCMAKGLAEMEGMPIRRVLVHGEKAAAYMADGYARANGKPGVCMAQAIGASNLAAGLRDGYMAGSPIIAITGGPTPEWRHRHAYQEVEDFTQFVPVTKFNAHVDVVTRIPDLLRQAFREATSGTPGPVHLQMLNRGGQMSEQEADLDPTVELAYAHVPPFRPEPEMQRVRDAVAALSKAKKPIIVAGGGVVRSSAQAEVVALAEKLEIPVITSLNAKGTILDGHPLSIGVSGSYSRDCANSTLLEADLVFFIGSSAGGMVTHFWHFPPAGTPVIQLDINPSELGRNYPNVVSIMGDAKVSLMRMIEVAQPKSPEAAKSWTDRVQELVAKWRSENEPNRNSDAVPIRPERICKEISDALPPDGVVVSDTGHAGIWTGTMLYLKHLTQRYFRCAGSLGWGFPGALGVKCALPDKPVLCFSGDGGFYYHIAELETAVRHKINLVVLVNNNSGLNQEITTNKVAYGGNPRGGWTDMWTFKSLNFAKIAEGFGCVGIRVEKPGEIRDAITRAFALNKPVVIDVVSDVNVLAKRVSHGEEINPVAQKLKIPPHDVLKDLQIDVDMLAPGADRLIGDRLSVELVAKGILFGEGPVWDRRKKEFFWTDIVGDTLWKWSPAGGQEVVLSPTVHANGMTLDREGRLVVAGWGGRTVFRLEKDGSPSTLASEYQGKKLNSPNDLVVKSDGTIYFTDSPGGLYNVGQVGCDLQRYLDFVGVFRISPGDNELRVVNSEFVYPNGLCFSPDEKRMYVNCSRERLIRVYDLRPDGGLANGRLFYQYSGPERGNPDGMKCDVDGNVYCTGPGGIWVHGPDGKVLARMKTAGHPTNFCFGGDDWKTFYITMMGSVVRTRLHVAGVAFW